MSQERYRQTGAADEFDTSLMYDDMERMKEIEAEEEKEQNNKLGFAGMMALVAGVSMLVVGGLGAGLFPPALYSFLMAVLPLLGILGLGYGFFKMLRLAFREKELNFPALNVYRKTRPAPATEETSAGERTADTQGARRRYRARSEARTRSSSYISQRKTLRRSRTNRVFTGVAGGLADYLGVSSSLIRFAIIFSLFPTSGMSLFIYLLLSIVIPSNYDTYQERVPRNGDRNRSR